MELILFCKDGFLDVLHTAIRKGLDSGRDEWVTAEATQRESGWLHLNGTVLSSRPGLTAEGWTFPLC